MKSVVRLAAIALALAGCQGPPPAPPPAANLWLRIRGSDDLARGVAIASEPGEVTIAGGPTLSLGVGVGPGPAEPGAVVGAAVTVLDLDGRALGPVARTDAAGLAGLAGPPPQAPGFVVAYFRSGGETYRVAAMIPKGGARGPIEVDPLSTMIAFAARAAARRQPDATLVGWDALTRARELCARGGLDAYAGLLAYTPGADVADDELTHHWHVSLSNLEDPAARAEVLRFAIDLEVLGDGPPPDP